MAAEAEAELAVRVGPVSVGLAPLADLPARVLVLLATVAEAEELPAEAAYWRAKAANTRALRA